MKVSHNTDITSFFNSGSNFDKNKILYILLGGFALATIILLAILCAILYKVKSITIETFF